MLPSSPPDASKNSQHIALKGDKRPIVELLPLEVIEYAFEIGARAEEADKGWDGVRNGKLGLDRPRQSPFPARVSHVCRRWRSIAIDMPTLWTTLDFMEPCPFEKCRVWLERSKKAPLDLAIDLSPVEDRIDVDGTDENQEDRDRSDMAIHHLDCILDLVIPHVSRWRSVQLLAPLYKMYSALRCLGKCPADPGAPILQAFVLCCFDEDLVDLTKQQYFKCNFPFGGHAPMLTQAVFLGVHIDWKLLIPPSERSALSSLYSIPTFTTNLTDLEFAYHEQDVRPSYEELITILRCAPHLSSLRFFSSGPALRQQGPVAQPIFLPNLRFLQLRWIEEEDACALLRLFYAPALRSISLSFDEEGYDAFVRQIAAPMPLPDPQSPGFRDLIFLPSSPGDDPNSSSLPEERGETGRFVDPREPKSILHNVTEVNLFSIACLADSPQHFYSASPYLKRLGLDMTAIPLEFFSVFMKDPAILGCQGGSSSTDLSLSSCSTDTTNPTASHPITPLCKRLESLTILGISGYQLIPFVKKRRAQGVPIRELNIKRGQRGIVTEEEGRWLIANVRSVEIV